METNLKGFAAALINAMEAHDGLSDFIDGTDSYAEVVSETEVKFSAHKSFDARLQGPKWRRGPGGRIPLGEVVYTVTITASVNPSDADEDGFLHHGVWILDPNMDEQLMHPVNPWAHYGESYRAYRTRKGLPVPLLSE